MVSSLSTINVSAIEDEFSTSPGTEFYEYTEHKDSDVDIFGGDDFEALIDQIDDDVIIEISKENISDNADLSSQSISSFSISEFDSVDLVNDSLTPEPYAELTMGFLQPVGGSGINGNIYSDSTGSKVLTYIAADVAYTGVIPFVDYKNGMYRIIIAGVDGWIKTSGFRAYAANTKDIKVNHYTPYADGRFFHYISRGAINTGTGYSYDGIGNGEAPAFLTPDVDYFSGDGHYFYKDVVTMLNDYRNNTRANSVNPKNPHYNYFQFLSYRTKSDITSSDLDGYLKDRSGYISVPESYPKLQKNQSNLLKMDQIHYFS